MTATPEEAAAQLEAIKAELADAEDEIHALRRRLQESPGRVQALEERLLESKGQLAQATSQNEKLTFTLQQAKEQLAALREEVEKLTQPPAAYGTFLGVNEDGTIDVFSSGRKMRVSLHPDIDPGQIKKGNEVVLNESLNVVLVRDGELAGEVVTLKEQLEDRKRCVIYARADEERVAELSEDMLGVRLRAGDSLLLDVRTQLLIEKLPKLESEELVLEEVPDITYADVGGLDTQIEAITDAVELPYMHRELFAKYSLPAPKGILLYGPPGCGKTLIAKAVANSLGEEGGREDRQRQRAVVLLEHQGPRAPEQVCGRDGAPDPPGLPAGTGEGGRGHAGHRVLRRDGVVVPDPRDRDLSDMESTIVPQLLAEIDGVESLRDVIVIGASNREDLSTRPSCDPGGST